MPAFPCHPHSPPFPCTYSPEGFVPSPKPPGPERERGFGNWCDLLAAVSAAQAVGSSQGPI